MHFTKSARTTAVAVAIATLALGGCSGDKAKAPSSPGTVSASVSVSPSGSKTTTARPVETLGTANALNSYFPVAAGNTWVYRTDYGPGSLGVVTYTERVAKVVRSGSDTKVTFQRSFHYESGKSPDMTTTSVYTFHRDGSISIPFGSAAQIPNTTVRVKSGSIVWPSAAELESGRARTGKVEMSTTIGGNSFDETVRFEIKGTGVEAVSVPAGRFQARAMEQTMRIEISGVPMGEQAIKTTTWLAKGIGMVRTVLKGGSLPTGGITKDVVTELVSVKKG